MTEATTDVEMCEKELKTAQEHASHSLIRICTMKLGSAYIANGKYDKGIKVLEKVLHECYMPRLNGDLYYELAKGYKGQKKHDKADEYFQLALKEYLEDPSEDNTALHIANERLNWLCCGQPITRKIEKAQAYRKLLQKMKYGPTLANIYNNLGTVFTQCMEYDSAMDSFQEARKIMESSKSDKSVLKKLHLQCLKPAILQNLGAVCILCKKFKNAIEFEEEAIGIYNRMENTWETFEEAKEKGDTECSFSVNHCLLNKAYAHSQISKQMKKASKKENQMKITLETFEKAYKEAEETNDIRSQWQALEGLATVRYHWKEYDLALENLNKALEKIGDCEHVAWRRIDEKKKKIKTSQGF